MSLNINPRKASVEAAEVIATPLPPQPIIDVVQSAERSKERLRKSSLRGSLDTRKAKPVASAGNKKE